MTAESPNPLEPLAQLFRDLRSTPDGAVLAWASGTAKLAIAIAAVIFLNAATSFAQELQAERAVEALAAFLAERARVLRDGASQDIEARSLVPGDVLLIEEGDRICADARLIGSTVEVDTSTLTG